MAFAPQLRIAFISPNGYHSLFRSECHSLHSLHRLGCPDPDPDAIHFLDLDAIYFTDSDAIHFSDPDAIHSTYPDVIHF